MTDLSYTNKDGLDLYEGFDNGFNYHKDGKESGDGYEHGGYPEVTGETSPYTDTSYKTGDDPDFFHNGNVWVQPSVNPGPGPEPPVAGYTVTFKPLVTTPIGRNDQPLEPDTDGLVTDGTYSGIFNFDEGENPVYSVTYNGVTYDNLSYTEPDTSGLIWYIGGVGNVDGAMMRTEWGNSFGESVRTTFVENDLPFALCTSTGDNLLAIFYANEVPETLDITITKTLPGETASCTIRLTSNELSLAQGMCYIPTESLIDLTDELNIENNARLNVTVDNEETFGIWTEINEDLIVLILDGYTIETMQNAPVIIYVQNSKPAFVRGIDLDEEVTITFTKKED